MPTVDPGQESSVPETQRVERSEAAAASPPDGPAVLAIDIGGTNVKIRIERDPQRRRFPSGLTLTPPQMVEEVRRLAEDWTFEAISIGVPAPVLGERVLREPVNLGRGWMDFGFAAAFGRPVKLVNDAAMQAVGSYLGGRMLFLGLGTGLGSCMIDRHLVQPMELAHLPFRRGRTYEESVGEKALLRKGKKRWRSVVGEVCATLQAALLPDYVVLGGGNARLLKELPAGCVLGDNANAFKGGFRLWRREWADSLPAPFTPPAAAATGERATGSEEASLTQGTAGQPGV
jgi:polyphosphate glucokinase